MIKKNNFVKFDIRKSNLTPWIIGAGLLFPLFFQLSGRVYNSINPVVDSGGLISQLPLPVSVLVCYGGLLLLAGRYRHATLALKVFAAMVAVMALSIMLAGSGIEFRKVILLIQVLLPVAGLVLGQLVEDKNKIIPRAFLGVLLLIVPVQLLMGWAQGKFILIHYLYIFSIYQHLQYVPLILVCAYAYSMSTLWDSYKKLFYLLIPIMFIYALESHSFLTIFAFVAFICAFAFVRLKAFKKIFAVALLVAAIAGIQVYFAIVKSQPESMRGFYEEKFNAIGHGETPRNVTDRLADWKLYENGIVESTKTFFIGHPTPFPRDVKTSAHNWYLDMAYNFGVISLIPVIFLMGYSLCLLWQRRKTLPEGTFWLGAIVFFLVVGDSNFKVTLRQPYPGIFTYFMWGTLLSHFRSTGLEYKH